MSYYTLLKDHKIQKSNSFIFFQKILPLLHLKLNHFYFYHLYFIYIFFQKYFFRQCPNFENLYQFEIFK
jgi:hypothetical protein